MTFLDTKDISRKFNHQPMNYEEKFVDQSTQTETNFVPEPQGNSLTSAGRHLTNPFPSATDHEGRPNKVRNFGEDVTGENFQNAAIGIDVLLSYFFESKNIAPEQLNISKHIVSNHKNFRIVAEASIQQVVNQLNYTEKTKKQLNQMGEKVANLTTEVNKSRNEYENLQKLLQDVNLELSGAKQFESKYRVLKDCLGQCICIGKNRLDSELDIWIGGLGEVILSYLRNLSEYEGGQINFGGAEQQGDNLKTVQGVGAGSRKSPPKKDRAKRNITMLGIPSPGNTPNLTGSKKLSKG